MEPGTTLLLQTIKSRAGHNTNFSNSTSSHKTTQLDSYRSLHHTEPDTTIHLHTTISIQHSLKSPKRTMAAPKQGEHEQTSPSKLAKMGQASTKPTTVGVAKKPVAVTKKLAAAAARPSVTIVVDVLGNITIKTTFFVMLIVDRYSPASLIPRSICKK